MSAAAIPNTPRHGAGELRPNARSSFRDLGIPWKQFRLPAPQDLGLPRNAFMTTICRRTLNRPLPLSPALTRARLNPNRL